MSNSQWNDDQAYGERALRELLNRDVETRKAVRYFCESVRHASKVKDRPTTGMQAPYHGPFCGASPGVMQELEWFVRLFEEATGEKYGG